MSKIQVDGSTVVTSEVRLSYVYLDKPRKSVNSDEERYSCMVIIPKSDTELINALKQAIHNAVEVAKQRGKGDVSKGRNPLKDGDIHTNMQGELLCEKAPEIKGCYIMNLSGSKQNKPRLYVKMDDKKMRPAENGDIYSGCYAQVYVNFYAYSKGAIGVGCGVRSVCKTRDGEPLGEAGMSDEDAFGTEVVAGTSGDEFM